MSVTVKGFEGLYTVDEFGRVYSVRNERFLNPTKVESGYLHVHLLNRGKGKCVRLHRLVAEHFIPNPHGYKQVNHKNGVKTDNRASNLEWCNARYNMQHAKETGLFKVSGEDNPSAKLTWKDVRQIRSEYVRGSVEHGTVALARRYNVSNVMIGKIVRGECWKDSEGFEAERSLHRQEGDV